MSQPFKLSSFPIREEIRSLFPDMVRIRRRIHRHPELGMQEKETSTLVAKELETMGLEVRTGVAGTGVVGLLRSDHPGKKSGVLLLRADMDALPMQEENPGIDYASEVPNVMHACGHDGHVATLLATARVASRMRRTLPGDLKFVFQPAEEGPGGALPMIEEGVLSDPAVTGAVGLHLSTEHEIGSVAVRAGPMMASADEFELRVVGQGGHGAYPHETVDAIVVGSHIVTALQTLVSRNTDPTQAAVVSVGTFNAGHNFNIIAAEARLRGTVRTFDSTLKDELKGRLGDLCRSVAEGMGARCEFVYRDQYPPLVNDQGMTDLVVEVASEMVGREAVDTNLLSMGGEDMCYFLQKVPGVFFFLGSHNPAKGPKTPHHSPNFDFDEEAMPLGVEIFLRFVDHYFRSME